RVVAAAGVEVGAAGVRVGDVDEVGAGAQADIQVLDAGEDHARAAHAEARKGGGAHAAGAAGAGAVVEVEGVDETRDGRRHRDAGAADLAEIAGVGERDEVVGPG